MNKDFYKGIIEENIKDKLNTCKNSLHLFDLKVLPL